MPQHAIQPLAKLFADAALGSLLLLFWHVLCEQSCLPSELPTVLTTAFQAYPLRAKLLPFRTAYSAYRRPSGLLFVGKAAPLKHCLLCLLSVMHYPLWEKLIPLRTACTAYCCLSDLPFVIKLVPSRVACFRCDIRITVHMSIIITAHLEDHHWHRHHHWHLANSTVIGIVGTCWQWYVHQRPETVGYRVLCMEWIDGVKLTDKPKMDAAGLDIIDFVDVGIECTLRQLLEHGYFHADPHPGKDTPPPISPLPDLSPKPPSMVWNWVHCEAALDYFPADPLPASHPPPQPPPEHHTCPNTVDVGIESTLRQLSAYGYFHAELYPGTSPPAPLPPPYPPPLLLLPHSL